MKKTILVIAALLLLAAASAGITFGLTYTDPDKAMVRSFVQNFGWHAAGDIQLFPEKPLNDSNYDFIKERVEPFNLKGLQLNLNKEDIGIREISQCLFNLKEKGMESPLECMAYLENHKIIAIVIHTVDNQYVRDQGIYPINESYDAILKDLQRQKDMGPAPETTNS